MQPVPIAVELNISPSQVAIAWAGSHGTTPIIGPRSLAQLTDNLGALSVNLSNEQLALLDKVSNVASLPSVRSPTLWKADFTHTVNK